MLFFYVIIYVKEQRMKEELYYRNLVRNKNIILSKELDEDVVILKKYDRNEFIITKDNLSKINIEYLKKINFSNKRIIISSLIFDIFNQDDVQKAENLKFSFTNVAECSAMYSSHLARFGRPTVLSTYRR